MICFHVDPKPHEESYEVFDCGFQLAVICRWGDLRHGHRWELDGFSTQAVHDYFQAWIDNNKHRIPSGRKVLAGV